MELNRIFENLKQINGTDLQAGSETEIMEKIVSATRHVGDDLPHYVIPKNFQGINPLSDEKEHIVAIHAMAGIGMMGFVDRLQLHPKDEVIIYEPDPGLAFLFLSQMDLKSFFNNCKVFLYINLNTFKTALDDIYEWWKDVHAWKSPVSSKQFPEKMDEFHQQVTQHVMMGKVNLNTLNKLYFEWVKNETINLDQLKQKKCATCFGQRMKNVPAILVGAGPSLQHGLSALKEIYKKKNALIIAASTSLRVLIPKGILPHFVVIIEGEKQAHFDNISHLDQLNLLAHLQTHPDHIQHAFKDVLWFIQETSPLAPFVQSILPENQPLKFSGNVLSAAFLLTATWGCNPITFIGMDLAHPNNGKYMKGLEKTEPEETPEKFYDVPGQNHDTLKAPPEFISYARNLEAAIVLNQKETPDLTVINASIGGRRIRGTMEMPLEQLATQISDQQSQLQPLLDDFMGSCAMLPTAQTDRFLYNQGQLYQDLQNMLKKEPVVPPTADQLDRIRAILNQLPEFTTHVSQLIRWVQKIRSGNNISEKDLISIKNVVDKILPCFSAI